MRSQEAIPTLQGCFERTHWSIFKDAATSGDYINLEEYIKFVLGCIRSGDIEDYYRGITEKTKEYMGKSCPISSPISRTQGAIAEVSGSDRLLAYGTCNEQ